MKNALALHWPEYAIEAAGLGLFMVSAGFFALALFHPGTAAVQAVPDLVHWHTIAITSDAQAAGRALLAAGRTLVSPGLVTLPGAGLGFREAFVVRDPDGHALQFRAQ